WNADNCDVPLPADEVERTARGIMRYSPGQFWTELGNSYRFLAAFSKELRFTRARGWLFWADTHWEFDSKNLDCMERMKKVAALLRAEVANIKGDDDLKKKGASWVTKSESARTMSNALELARSAPEVRADINDFDRDPYLFAVENAVIDLRTGVAHSHCPDQLITRLSSVIYDAAATQAPRWERFLDQTFAGDKELISWVQRVLGYTMTGLNNESKLFVCYGEGRNGKGVLMNILRHILGPFAQSPQRNTFIVNGNKGIPDDLAALRGARAVICDEFPTNSKPNEELLKQVSGGDPITARALYGDYFTYVPSYKLFLITNKRLNFSAYSQALWARVLEVPFSVVVPEKDRDPHLADALKKESSAILNWMVRGAQAYFSEGLAPPSAVISATASARGETDSVKAYRDEVILAAPGQMVGATRLYDHYVSWCRENDHVAVKKAEFKKQFMNRFGTPYVRHSAGWFWDGISIMHDVQNVPDLGSFSKILSLNS
ncbi:phage/plasmid primase, P4 family, partial [Faunimonas sp. B44]|uniref:phage/plasmid primase, P4 family n=1 Tax=Faunimonas sp. B44 TaxID=3461493 RepID=UPI004043E591